MKSYKMILSHGSVLTVEKNFCDVFDKNIRDKIHCQFTTQILFTKVTSEITKELNNLFDQLENTISCYYHDLKDF